MFAVAVCLALMQLAFGDDSCPAMYLRYSPDPSYCLQPSTTCNVIKKDVTDDEKKIILDEHNKKRNTIAMGEETQAGGLPEASNMMEFIWDDELEKSAQRWVDQCTYRHDCEDSKCREVLDYGVGQNIGQLKNRNTESTADWPRMIQMFYDEIKVFPKDKISDYVPNNYGHFTQLIWADTWRIGCGWVLYEENEKVYDIYACDYGPTGNTQDGEIYKQGSPCSECPENSCCGDDCDEATDYPGLCHMLEDDEAPKYKVDKDDYIYYCDFGSSDEEARRKRQVDTINVSDLSGFSDSDESDSSSDEDWGNHPAESTTAASESDSGEDAECCDYTTSGTDKWEILETLTGNKLNILLNGGENSTVHFTKPINSDSNICVVVRYRSGPNKVGDKDDSVLIWGVEPMSGPIPLYSSPDSFVTNPLPLDSAKKMKISYTFSVPSGSPPQYFTIEKHYVLAGKCP